MRRLTRAILLLAAVAGALPGIVPAQGRATVKIATQSPLSAERAQDGEGIRLGAELAIEQLKGPAEQMGFRIELLSFDDEGRPDVAVANARNIVADREILAVVGHLEARVAVPASEIYKDATLAMVSPAGTGTLLTDRNLPGVSRVCGRDDVQGLVAADFAAGTLMVKTVYILHDGTTAAQDVAELFKTEAERRGVKVAGFETVRGPADVDPLVAAIRARPPELVFFSGRAEPAAAFWRRAHEQGVKTRLLGPDGLDSPAFARMAGTAAVGVYYTSAVAPAASLPGARAFVDDFQRRFGRAPGPYAAEAYDATAIVLRAIESAGRGGVPSRETVAAAVRRTKHEGVTGEIEFDSRGDRKKAPYFVRQVASEDPERWSQNKIVKQMTAGPPRT